MKKILLSACMIFATIFSASAQLPYQQNFESSMTNLPAGWSVGVAGSHPGNPGWEFNNAWPVAGSSLWQQYTATHTYCAFVDDIDYNTGKVVDHDTLYTNSFSCSSNAHVFISLDLNFNNYTDAEVGTIAVSTNGGVTWVKAVNLPSGYGDITWHNGLIFDLSPFAAGHSSVMLAFTWNNVGAVSQGYAGWGMAVDNISVYSPVSYDLSVLSQNNSYLMQVGKSYNFSGLIGNFGGDSVVSMDMNYQVDNNPAVPSSISGIVGFNSLTEYNWTMSAPYVPLTTGTHTIKFYANNLNGLNVDQNHSNDTLSANFLVVDSIQPKMVMFEEFSCASCNPCMYAMPNIDSVSQNTVNYCNTIRYHWYFPGQDMINLETATLVNDRFETYYGQNGVPDGALDGSIVAPSPNQGNPYFSSAMVQAEAAQGSPFKITTQASYDAVTETYSLTATIKSYGTFAAGLTAQVALTEDSVDFKTDQSTEDPASSFAFNGGPNPNSYYDLVLNFPNAVEDMLPSVNGTALGAFTPGSTQTVTVSWTKNHPWAAKYTSYPYDSSTTQHLTIFIQDNSANSAIGTPAKYVFQSASAQVSGSPTDVQEVSSGTVHFELYPNPTNNNTNIAFDLDKDQNVSVDVYNMLGEKVYTDNEGMMSSGQHTIVIDGSALQSGVYFVRFTTDNAISAQKLVIQK